MTKNEIERVMQLAAEIFAEHGFTGVGMRELCDRCGVGAPTIYHYFGSKERLFEEVCADKYRKAMTQVSAVVDPHLSLEQQIDALCASLFELLVHDRVLFLLLRRDLINGSIEGRTLHSRRQYDGIIELLRKVLLRVHGADEAQRLAFTMASLLFGYCEFVRVSFNLRSEGGATALAAHRRDMTAAVRKLVIPD